VLQYRRESCSSFCFPLVLTLLSHYRTVLTPTRDQVAINSLVIYAITRSRTVRRWRGYQGRVSTKPMHQDTYAEEHHAHGGCAPRPAAAGGGGGGDDGVGTGSGLRSIAWTTQDKDQRSSSQSRFPRHALSLNLTVDGGGLMSEKSHEVVHHGGSSRVSFPTRQCHGFSLNAEDAGDDSDRPSKAVSPRDLERQGHSAHEKADGYDDHHHQDGDDEDEDEDEDGEQDDYEDGEGYNATDPGAAQRQSNQPRPPRAFIVRTPRLRRSIDSAASSAYSLSSGYTMYAAYSENDTTASTPDTSAPPSATSPIPPTHAASAPLSLLSPLSDSLQPPQSQAHLPVPVHPFPPYSVHDTIHADLAFARRNSVTAATVGGTSPLLPSSPSPSRPLHHSSSYPPSSSRATSDPSVPQERNLRSRTRSRERERSGRGPKLGPGSAPEPLDGGRNRGRDEDNKSRFLSLTEALAELDYTMPSLPASAVVSRNYHSDGGAGAGDNDPDVQIVCTVVPAPEKTGPSGTRSSSTRRHSAFGIPFQLSSPFGSIPKPKPKPKVPP
jgi:hypothetical protein